MKRLFVGVMVSITMLGAMLAPVLASPATAYAACDDKKPIMGITRWYRGLVDSNCAVVVKNNDIGKFITMLVLNILQAGFAVAAYVTIFFIIKGGISYMTSTGSPDGMSKAKNTIKNAVVGLIIVLLSAGIVNTIASII